MSGTLYTNASLVCRLLRLTWRHRRGCAVLLGLQFVSIALQVVGVALLGAAIDTLGHLAGHGPPPVLPLGVAAGLRPQAMLPTIAAAMVVVALVRAVVNYGYAAVSSYVLQRQLVVELRAAVHAHLQSLGGRFLQRFSTGSLISRVTGDVQSLRMFIDGVFLQGAILVVSLGFYLVCMTRIDAGLTAACLATMPLLALLAARYARAVRPAHNRNRELSDQMILSLAETVRGIQVVKGFGREEERTAAFAEANVAVRRQQGWIFWRTSLFTPAAEMLMAVNMAVLLGYGGWLVIEGRLALGGGLIVFSSLLQQFAGQVTKITGIVNSIMQSLAGAERVFEVLDTPPEVVDPPRPRRLHSVRGTLELVGVCHQYRSDRPVLKDVCLRIEAGERIALLGATGAGKSTLLALLLRLMDPSGGSIRLDGIDLRELALDDLRRQVGIVFQESYLFTDTVAANIALARPQATPAEIERAARLASAHDFVAAMPDGYQTVLREGGKDLSGGQRQRLAIARALLAQPRVLLLDDPTAAIDPETEGEILTAMQRAMAGRTTLFVAHRASTLRSADRIVVLDAGAIVECGTHDELWAQGGLYRRALAVQESRLPLAIA